MSIKTFFIIIFLLCVAAVSISAQAECPPDKVCISPAAAQKALADADTVKAQKAEIAGLKQAVEDMRKLLNDMRIEFARVSGETTALRQNAVSDRAIMEILVKNTKKRCAPLSILCL